MSSAFLLLLAEIFSGPSENQGKLMYSELLNIIKRTKILIII